MAVAIKSFFVQFKYNVQPCEFIKFWSVHVTFAFIIPFHFLICGYLLRTPNNSRDQHCFIVHWKNINALNSLLVSGSSRGRTSSDLWLSFDLVNVFDLFFLPSIVLYRSIFQFFVYFCLILCTSRCMCVFFFFLCFYIVLYFCLHETTYSVIFLPLPNPTLFWMYF